MNEENMISPNVKGSWVILIFKGQCFISVLIFVIELFLIHKAFGFLVQNIFSIEASWQ